MQSRCNTFHTPLPPSPHGKGAVNEPQNTHTRARSDLGRRKLAGGERKRRQGREKKVGKKKETGESKEVPGLKGASLRKPGADGLFYMVIFYPLRPR